MSDRPTVRCLSCELKQYVAPWCRRCGHDLPPLEVVKEVIVERVIEKVVEKVVEHVTLINPVTLLAVESLPSADEWELIRIREAFRRAKSLAKVAKILGVSKTTLHRWVRRYPEVAA